MYTLIKKDFLLFGPIAYSFIALLILLMSVVTLPAMFVMTIAVFSLVLSTFTYEDKNKVNLFLISMPVDKRNLVISRYLYGLSITGLILFFQWFIQWCFTQFFATFPHTYHWFDFVMFFCLAMVIVSICFPILYFFRNHFLAIGLIILLLFIGTFFTLDPLVIALGMTDEILFNHIDTGYAILAKQIFPKQPYFFTVMLSTLLIILSYIVSSYIVRKKDF